MTVSFTSPGDDLDSDSPVSSYLIRVSDGDQETLIGEADLAGEHNLSPVPGGDHKEIKIKFVLIHKYKHTYIFLHFVFTL